MHELFTKVLSKRDLSRAGDLFSVADYEIVNDLTQVVSLSKYLFYVKLVSKARKYQAFLWELLSNETSKPYLNINLTA